MAIDWTLNRGDDGRLSLLLADQSRHNGVVPVRAFPISERDRHIALVGAEGRELLWIDDLASVPAEARALVEEELSRREFLPVITHILGVSTLVEPSEWTVETDRGPTRFTLNSEEDVRRLGPHQTIIVDSQGVRYLVRDRNRLDANSRRTLDRFL